MKNICFCFQMHIPTRLKRYRFFEIGQDHYYYDDMATEEYVSWIVNTSFMPLCQTIREMIRLSKNKFRCAIAVSGTTLELFEQFTPEMIDILKELADSRCIEFPVVPYAYSLAGQINESEFHDQLTRQADKVQELFSVHSDTVWNTCLLYSDEIAEHLFEWGYRTLMGEGAQHVLSWKSPHYLYQTCVSPKQHLLLRDEGLSDALSFHFSDSSYPDYPLDAEKFIRKLNAFPQTEELINIWMGAESFGIFQNTFTGIFEFMKALPYYAMEQGLNFLTPAEASQQLGVKDPVAAPYPLTWTGAGKDLSTFMGNDLQVEAVNKLYAVTERVHLCQDASLKADWLLLQDINYLQYMNHIDRGSSTFESAYDAFINYMNILSDFLQRVDEQYPTTIENEELNALLKTINNQEKEIADLQEQISALKKKSKKS